MRCAYLCGCWLLLLCAWLPADSSLGSPSGTPTSATVSKEPGPILPQPSTTLQKYQQLVTEMRDTLSSLRQHSAELSARLAESQATLTDLQLSFEASKRLEASLLAGLQSAETRLQEAQAAATRDRVRFWWRTVLVGAGAAVAGLLAGLLLAP